LRPPFLFLGSTKQNSHPSLPGGVPSAVTHLKLPT
jgi:hypothetical protein